MSLRVLHFANNLTDGAGRAAYRLHRALRDCGVDSRMVIFQKVFDDDTVTGFLKTYANPGEGRDYRYLSNKARYLLRKIVQEIRLGIHRPSNLFTLNMPFVRFKDIASHLETIDFICLHSIESFLSSALIKKMHDATGVPIIWNVVDSEPLTGGCHFNDGCERFARECGRCPQLRRPWAGDRSRRTLRQKMHDLNGLPIVFASASSCVRENIQKSALFRDHAIKSVFLSVDGSFRFEIPREMAREVIGLPKKKKIILFGCFNIDEERKGGHYLVESLKLLAADNSDPDCNENIILVTVGGKNDFDKHNLPFEWIHLGKITDDRVMALAYKAADVFACPSIDDFGPIMINEAIVCRTPVVAFRSGVAPDLIVDDTIGYLAAKKDAMDFKNGLFRFVNGLPPDNPSQACQLILNQLEPAHQASEYIALFNALTEESR